MGIHITSATKDCLTCEWEVEAIINGKRKKYILSDYDYERCIKCYHRNNYPETLNILKEGL